MKRHVLLSICLIVGATLPMSAQRTLSLVDELGKKKTKLIPRDEYLVLHFKPTMISLDPTLAKMTSTDSLQVRTEVRGTYLYPGEDLIYMNVQDCYVSYDNDAIMGNDIDCMSKYTSHEAFDPETLRSIYIQQKSTRIAANTFTGIALAGTAAFIAAPFITYDADTRTFDRDALFLWFASGLSVSITFGVAAVYAETRNEFELFDRNKPVSRRNRWKLKFD